MRAAVALAFFILLPLCSSFDLSPANPNPGEKITLTGRASPDEQIPFRSSFSLELPVREGRYEYETSVEIPQKPNGFTITARDVRDLNAGVKMGIWLTKRFQAIDGKAGISQADIPPGRYNVKMFGEAMPGVATVPVEVVAETAIKADSLGRYSMVIDTSGIPGTEYRITGAGDSKTVSIGDSAQSKSTAGSEDEPARSHAGPEIRQAETTPEVIEWYANQIGIDSQHEGRYAEAKDALKKRLSGGYWKIIAIGEPLTEEAGNCEQKYCLVRGIDACTVCREKDILLEGNKSAKANQTEEIASSVPENIVLIQQRPEEKKGFISMIIDWTLQMLHIGSGAERCR